jgi:hypothetical protein
MFHIVVCLGFVDLEEHLCFFCVLAASGRLCLVHY